MKKTTRRTRPEAKRKRPFRAPYSNQAWEPSSAPAPETGDDVNELGSWPLRRGTAEDERRRIAASFRDMGIGTD